MTLGKSGEENTMTLGKSGEEDADLVALCFHREVKRNIVPVWRLREAWGTCAEVPRLVAQEGGFAELGQPVPRFLGLLANEGRKQ